MQDECVWGVGVENLVRTLIASARREYAVGRVGGGCVASNLGRASQAQARGVVLGAATSCCYVLLLSSTLCYFYYLALPGMGRSRVEQLWESSASLLLAASVDK